MKALKLAIRSRSSWLRRGLVFLLVGLIYALPFFTVTGIAAIYLKLGTLEGDVTVKGYEKWIQVDSVQFGVGRSISSPTGGTRDASAPSVSEVTLTKPMDKSHPGLFSRAVGAAGGSSGETAQLYFVRTGNNGLETYYKIDLSEALVSGFSVSSGGDLPFESLSLNFTKITVTYSNLAPAGYDLKAAKGF